MYEFIGIKIKEARESKGLSQKSLGEKLHLSDRTISSYEGGKKLPMIDTLFELARELDKPVTHFLMETDDEATLAERVHHAEDILLDLLEEVRSIKASIAPQGLDMTPPNIPG